MNNWLSALKEWAAAAKLRLYVAWEKLLPLLKRIDWSDPRTWGIVAVGTILLIVLIWLIVRAAGRKRSRGGTDEPAGLRSKLKAKHLEKTLHNLREVEPQFVELIDSILKDRSVDQLLSYDEINDAFGRLSEIEEKNRQVPNKRSSMLSLEEDHSLSKEKNAAMLTVVRSCYSNEAIYSMLDEKSRRLVDQFLDSVVT